MDRRIVHLVQSGMGSGWHGYGVLPDRSEYAYGAWLLRDILCQHLYRMGYRHAASVQVEGTRTMASEVQRWYRDGVPVTNPVPSLIYDQEWDLLVAHVNDGVSVTRLAKDAGVTPDAMRARLLRVVRRWNHDLIVRDRQQES